MASATTVYTGQPGDMYIAAQHDDGKGFERDFVSRTIASWNDELFLRAKDDAHGCASVAGAGCAGAAGKLTKVDAPNSAAKSVHREWLTMKLREPYASGGKTFAAGALIATKFDDFMAGKRDFDVLFAPSDTTSLDGSTWTRSDLVLNVLDDVKSRLSVLTPGADGWKKSAFDGAPKIGTVGVGAVDSDDSDAVWMTVTNYLTPTTLALAEIGQKPEVLKSNPAYFDVSKSVVEQHFATSKDGTKVPYFLVRPNHLALDGKAPTLLYGYGGFTVSLKPGYSGVTGKGWIEKGGVYAVANIRGGGEYGPRWHQAALKAHRQRPMKTSRRWRRIWLRARLLRRNTWASKAAATAACSPATC